MCIRRILYIFLVPLGLLILASNASYACIDVFFTSNTPLRDLTTGQYLGYYQGGLYPDGLNALSEKHKENILNQARLIEPLCPDGSTTSCADADKQIVFLSIGHSVTTSIFCGKSPGSGNDCRAGSFKEQATVPVMSGLPRIPDDQVNSKLGIVDGALGGVYAFEWAQGYYCMKGVVRVSCEGDWDLKINLFDRIRDERLNDSTLEYPESYDENQVQAVWVKTANLISSYYKTAAEAPSLAGHMSNTPAEAYRALEQFGGIVRQLKIRYPYLKVVFFSDRTYQGYSMTDNNGFDGSEEPYSYEYGFSVKWMIESQINQLNNKDSGFCALSHNLCDADSECDVPSGELCVSPGNLDKFCSDSTDQSCENDSNCPTGETCLTAPLVVWGPDLWADNILTRSDGHKWEEIDYSDCGHLSSTGVDNAGSLLMNYFNNSRFATEWFCDDRIRVNDTIDEGITTLTGAYNQANPGDIIRSSARVYKKGEDDELTISLDNNSDELTFDGGYNCEYECDGENVCRCSGAGCSCVNESACSLKGYVPERRRTIFQGDMHITKGTINLGNFRIAKGNL